MLSRRTVCALFLVLFAPLLAKEQEFGFEKANAQRLI
jgi:hypothetical protein